MRLTLFRIFIRSFFIQSSLNFERMQNIGFCMALEPALKKIYSEREKLFEAYQRHFEFFNTHPYLSNLMLGLMAGMEEELAQYNKENKGSDAIQKENMMRGLCALKQQMAGPLAAIGDSFFWSTWRPLCGLVSIAVAFFVWVNQVPLGMTERGLFLNGHLFPPLLPAIFFLFVYNCLHLPLRYWLVAAGYQRKSAIISALAQIKIQKIIFNLRRGGMLLLGALLIWMGVFFALKKHIWILLFIPLFLIDIACIRRKVSPTKIFYATLAAGLIIECF